MEVNVIDQFFLNFEEPYRSCYLSLREIVLNSDDNITEHWKYSVPFYYYKGKPFCYFWKDKKTDEPYIGMVRANGIEHPSLFQGSRKKMKIMKINPELDIPLTTLNEVLEELKTQY
jgi:hypothetical protein